MIVDVNVGDLKSFSVSQRGTWLIATSKFVVECTFVKSKSHLSI
jgi:hypothetical protein